MAEADPMPSATSRITATVAGTHLELLQGGRERLDVLLRLIDEAQHSIKLLFYMFNADATGETVRDALIRAAGRGVEVRLLLDGFGSSITSAFLAPVAEAGGRFILFHPSLGRRYLLRNHQKLLVVDDHRAITGGANIDTHYVSDHGPEHWRDLWLLLDGAAVRAAGRYFDAIWRWSAQKGGRIRSLRRIIQRHSQRKGAIQWWFSGPMRRRNPWPVQIAREIVNSSRLDLISAYFSPPFAMMRRLARAGRSGRVRIITAARSDNNATIAAARHTYSKLLRNGVEMYEYDAAKLHSKLVIVDDVVHIGSSNFDFRSLHLNLEVMVRIDDPSFAEQCRAYFDGELADSVAITPELHKQRAGWLRRAKWTVSHWLVTTMDYNVTRRLNFGTER